MEILFLRNGEDAFFRTEEVCIQKKFISRINTQHLSEMIRCGVCQKGVFPC